MRWKLAEWVSSKKDSIARNANSIVYISRTIGYFSKYSAVLQFPRIIQLQTQSLCNGQCPICPFPGLKDKLEQGTMAWDIFKKIADQAAKEPLFSELCFMLQNEPLLDRRIFQWVRYFKDLNRKKMTKIVTNGALISKFTLKEITDSGLDSLVISLNAHTEQTFNIINRGIEYREVMENIRLLLSDPFVKPRLTLRFVLTKINAKEIKEAVSFWRKKGVKTQVARGLSNRAGALESYHRYKSEAMDRAILTNIKRRLLDYCEDNTLGCFMPFSSMCILFNGDIILCYNNWNRAPIIGNANQDLLQAIWNSDKMNNIRMSISKRKYADAIPCGQCYPVRY